MRGEDRRRKRKRGRILLHGEPALELDFGGATAVVCFDKNN